MRSGASLGSGGREADDISLFVCEVINLGVTACICEGQIKAFGFNSAGTVAKIVNCFCTFE